MPTTASNRAATKSFHVHLPSSFRHLHIHSGSGSGSSSLNGLYHPLNPQKSEIRLLRVRPCTKEVGKVHLKFRMVTVSLQDHPPQYWALSYVHGDETKTEKVDVNHAKVEVSSTLAEALRYIFTSKHQLNCNEFYLWVDALCINPTDLAEKGSQVQIMRAIYQEAFAVLSWLGPGTDQQRKALDTVSDVAHHVLNSHKKEGATAWETGSFLENFDGIIDKDTWMALEDLDNLQYWHRLWVIQEICAAKWVLFLCGHSFTRCIDMDIVLSWKSRIQTTSQPSRPSAMEEELWSRATSHSAWSWFQISFMMRLRDSFKSQKLSVLETPWVSRYFGASDPRDRVYAVQGLMEGMDVVVDYNKPVHTVYEEFLRRWVASTDSLEHLFYAGIGHFGSNDVDLPSWVPNLHRIACDEGRREEFNPVGRRQDEHRMALGADFDGAAKANNNVSVMDFAANVFSPTGFVLDTVSKTDRLSSLKDLLLFAYGFACGCDNGGAISREKCYPTCIPKSQAALRLILVNLSRPANSLVNNGFNALDSGTASDTSSTSSSTRSPNVAENMWLGEIYGALRDHLLILMKDPTLDLTEPERAEVVEFLDDVLKQSSDDEGFVFGYNSYKSSDFDNLKKAQIQNVGKQLRHLLDNRSVFQTGNGYLGLGPPGMTDSDEVVVIPGFRYPVLLRKLDGTNAYQFVGACYIAGIMNGITCEAVDEGFEKLVKLEIR